MDAGEYRFLVSEAQRLLGNGRSNGSIIAKPCEKCGKIEVDGHHPDYRKPFEIVWLCRTHHRNLHKGVLQFLGPDTIYRTFYSYGGLVLNSTNGLEENA